MPKTLIDIKKTVKRLLDAKEAYYNDTPLMPDADFDALEDELKKADPSNAYFKKVGATGNTKTKLKHEFPMLSAGKAKTVAEVMSWIGKVKATGSYQVEPKIDGLSATIKYKEGHLVYVATRGDGKVGQDITHIVANGVQGIASKIPWGGDVEIRGELYIPKDTTMPNPNNSPLRNLAVGLINRKGENHSLADLKYVKFVAYNVIGDAEFKTEHEKLSWLKKQRFNVIPTDLQFKTEAQLTKIHSDYLSKYRNEWEFETDGLVIVVDDITQHEAINSTHEVSHHNHYNIALKPPSEGKETELLDIEWNVSRQGKLVPIAIVKPVVLGGATVQRCTLNNYGNVWNLTLHKGDKVMIERANDVIPFFKQNLTTHSTTEKALIPSVCPACSKKVTLDGIHLVCTNSKCEEQAILKVVHWVKNCNMEFFSEASVRQLFAAGKLKDIRDLYALKEKDCEGVDGFGKSKTANALKQIASTKEMTIGEFVDRLGIDLVGEKAMIKLGITSVKELLAHKDRTFVIGEKLMDYVAENKDFINDLLSVVTITKPVAMKAGAKQVCMTGTGPKGRNELVAEISKKGDVFVDRVTKDTSMLICEDVNGESTKLEKARKMGVKLVSYKEYFK